MISEVFEKYKENFKHFLVYFVLSVILSLIMTKLDLTNPKVMGVGTSLSFKDYLNGKELLKLFGITLIEVYIMVYGLIVARKVIKDEPIDQRESFSDVFSFYPRFLFLNIAFIVIMIFIVMLFIFIIARALGSLGMLIFMTILMIISIAIFGVFTNVIQSYLICNDEKISLSIKEGIKIGKKYFYKILGLLIIAALIGSLGGTEIAKNNMVVLAIASLILSMYTMFLNLYVINLCKLER